MRAALAPHDLTHVQFVLLASLWWLDARAQEPPTQSQLAAHAGVDAMMTSQVLRRLEADGLLRRAADPGDARARRLQITPAGRRRAQAAVADVEAADDEYFAAIDAADRDHFLTALRALGPDCRAAS